MSVEAVERRLRARDVLDKLRTLDAQTEDAERNFARLRPRALRSEPDCRYALAASYLNSGLSDGIDRRPSVSVDELLCPRRLHTEATEQRRRNCKVTAVTADNRGNIDEPLARRISDAHP